MYIGIVTRYKSEIIESKERLFIHLNYDFYKKLLSLNFLPIIIPYDNYEKYLSICSGFIITGGSDINPYYYGVTVSDNSNLNDIDDKIDFQILNYAVTRNIPVLGICRGMQVINVYFGGSLYQDIKHHYEKHYVLYKNRKFIVNSSHHQGIKNLGVNLISIFSFNNLIESIHHVSLPIFGIQWHPERMDDLSSSFIFKYFKKLVTSNNF